MIHLSMSFVAELQTVVVDATFPRATSSATWICCTCEFGDAEDGRNRYYQRCSARFAQTARHGRNVQSRGQQRPLRNLRTTMRMLPEAGIRMVRPKLIPMERIRMMLTRKKKIPLATRK